MPFILGFKDSLVTYERGDSLFVIGERINPTSNRSVRESIQREEMDLILTEAQLQVARGVQALDVNVGTALDQPRFIKRTVREIESRLKTPLVLDSSSPDVLKAGLEEAEGRVLLNSMTGEEKSMQAVLALAGEYRVPLVGLTIDENGTPKTCQERVRIAEKIILRALSEGIPKDDIVIDPVLFPLKFYPDQIYETLMALKTIRETWDVWTCLGISNVSFGLKKRRKVNAGFLLLALGFGLDIGILDPLDHELMEVVKSSPRPEARREAVECFKRDCYAVNS